MTFELLRDVLKSSALRSQNLANIVETRIAESRDQNLANELDRSKVKMYKSNKRRNMKAMN